LEEIKEWSVVDDHRRRIIVQNAGQRRQARQNELRKKSNCHKY
jgi:predicted Fe-S protein YdhL (DUF1289 family)